MTWGFGDFIPNFFPAFFDDFLNCSIKPDPKFFFTILKKNPKFGVTEDKFEKVSGWESGKSLQEKQGGQPFLAVY